MGLSNCCNCNEHLLEDQCVSVTNRSGVIMSRMCISCFLERNIKSFEKTKPKPKTTKKFIDFGQYKRILSI